MGCSSSKVDEGLIDPDELGPEPVSLKCPNCKENITTTIEKFPRYSHLDARNSHRDATNSAGTVPRPIPWCTLGQHFCDVCCFLCLSCILIFDCCYLCVTKDKIKHKCPKCDVHLGTVRKCCV